MLTTINPVAVAAHLTQVHSVRSLETETETETENRKLREENAALRRVLMGVAG